MPRVVRREQMETDIVVPTDLGPVQVPIDKGALAELADQFAKLSNKKQEWLLCRFPFADSDAEATRMLHDKGIEVGDSTVRDWKDKDPVFMRAYTLLAGRMVDWARYVAMSIEAGNAIKGALENRKLMDKPWEELDARGTSAKEQAIQGSLDRLIGRKQEVDLKVIRVEDLLPKVEG